MHIYIKYGNNPDDIEYMKSIINSHHISAGDALCVIPKQPDYRKKELMQRPRRCEAQVIFYQTPHTIKNHIYEKPFEVYLVNWISPPHKSHISETFIPPPSDREFNFRTQVFRPSRQTI